MAYGAGLTTTCLGVCLIRAKRLVWFNRCMLDDLFQITTIFGHEGHYRG